MKELDPIQKAIKESCPDNILGYAFHKTAAEHLYEKMENHNVRCNACKRHCVIPPGQTGFCLARENEDGTLINRAYGSLHGLYPDTRYLGDGTEAMAVNGYYCNCRCKFCFAETWIKDQKELPELKGFTFPFNGKRIGDEEIELGRIATDPRTIITLCKQRFIKTIVIGRSEPTTNVEFFMELAAIGINEGIKTICCTNGYSTESVNRDYAALMSEIVVGIKAYFDQAAYDNVVGKGIDVNGILETLFDLHRWNANYCINLLADGQHGDPREAYKMFGKLKEHLTEEEAKRLNIHIQPVIRYSNRRYIIDPDGNGLLHDQLNVRPGDIIGALELEMGLKRMGFHCAYTSYSADYKEIHGAYPSFWHEEAKNGWLAEVEKQPAKNDIKSYVYLR